MNILISNDDGINSKTLRTLVKELSDIANVYVIAPDSERSANSHHFTISGRMRIEEKELDGAIKAYALWGTPCDCIRVGIDYLIKEKIDLVVSGINKGWNTSNDMVYSGTVAAAKEAFMQGIKSIAFSLNTYEDIDYSEASKVAKELIIKYMENPISNYFLNVNIPDLPLKDIKGIKVCDEIGIICYDNCYSLEEEFGVKYIKLKEGKEIYKYDINNQNIDCVAVNNGYITVVPVDNDQISRKYINEVKKLYEK